MEELYRKKARVEEPLPEDKDEFFLYEQQFLENEWDILGIEFILNIQVKDLTFLLK